MQNSWEFECKLLGIRSLPSVHYVQSRERQIPGNLPTILGMEAQADERRKFPGILAQSREQSIVYEFPRFLAQSREQSSMRGRIPRNSRTILGTKQRRIPANVQPIPGTRQRRRTIPTNCHRRTRDNLASCTPEPVFALQVSCMRGMSGEAAKAKPGPRCVW